MIILITGASHTGKTALAQKFLEKYKYPYLSIDHLKMGLIRSGYTDLTPMSNDADLTAYLWPIVREMIKTAIENKQNLIVEGCYIPFDWAKDFSKEYLYNIRYYCLVMSEKYIKNHFSAIKKYANIIENRVDDSYCTLESVLADNAQVLELARKHSANYILIDDNYELELAHIEQIEAWRAEESVAHIHGWDFSHIDGRYTQQDDLPWDYRSVIMQYLTPEMRLLDIDTGGGEFLLSLHHPYQKTAATENYPPNVQLCQELLLPLGIDFRSADGKGLFPFPDNSFDMVINRHGDFNAKEIYRMLKPNGLFITQQVGAENDRELVELLCGETELPFPEQYLNVTSRKFEDAGFTILRGEECFRPIKFYDVGALVWFARIIEWEFPDFSVEKCLNKLINAQKVLDEHGSIDGSIHRFLLVAKKQERSSNCI